MANPADDLTGSNHLTRGDRHGSRSQVREQGDGVGSLDDDEVPSHRVQAAPGGSKVTMLFTTSASSRTRWIRVRSGTRSTAATTWPSKAVETGWPIRSSRSCARRAGTA
jgi:hypothetical protein